MLNERAILECIDSMPLEELVKIMQESLDESHIPYDMGVGEILFDGFLTDEREISLKIQLNDACSEINEKYLCSDLKQQKMFLMFSQTEPLSFVLATDIVTLAA